MNKLLAACLSTMFFLSTVLLAGSYAGDSPQGRQKKPGRHKDPQESAEHRDTAPPPRPSSQGVGLTLADAIRYGIEGNQDIKVVSYNPKQSREEVTRAEAVYDYLLFTEGSYTREPDLQSSITDIVMQDTGVLQTGVRKPLSTGGTLSSYLETRYEKLLDSSTGRRFSNIFAPTIELKQPLLKDLGSRKEKAAIKIARFQANISEQEFRQKVIEIAADVSQAYWQLYLYLQLVKIDQENLNMAREVCHRETVRVAHGLSQPVDVERARSNEQSRRNALLVSGKRVQLATEKLKLLLNNSSFTIDSKMEILPTEEPRMEPQAIDEDELMKAALVERPELQKAMQILEVRKAEEELTGYQRLPKLDVFGRFSFSGYGNEFRGAVDDVTANRDSAWAVGLSFEMPIGNRAANAAHRQKVLGRGQAGAQIEGVRNKIKLDVKQVVLGILAACGEIDSTRLAMQAAEKVVAGEFARYEIGQTTNDELLRAQDLLATTSRSFVGTVVDYNITLAELARVQGALPHGLSLENATK
jgi:outer membrane protein